MSNRVSLFGSARTSPVGDVSAEPADPGWSAFVTVHLRRRELGGRERPASRILSRAELTELYGADPHDFVAIRNFAGAYHLEVRNESPAKRSAELHGTLAQLSEAFGVTLHQVSIEGRLYRSFDGEITVPDDLANILVSINGLDNRPLAKPFYQLSGPAGTMANAVPATPFPVPQVAQLYNFPSGLDGSGQTIAILEFGGGYSQGDLTSYFEGLGLATPTVSSVGVDGCTNSPGGNDDCEVTLDIEIAGALAPGAKQLIYFAPNTDQGFLDAINEAVNGGSPPTVVSISWGSAESTWSGRSMSAFESILEDAANMGVPVCVAAGDQGSSAGTSGLAVCFPASAPHALACGGTSLLASGASIGSEVVWNSNGKATGGGVSAVFAKPGYQSGVSIPPPSGQEGGRGVPDVAGDADPNTGYLVFFRGQTGKVGGTSAVAPLWSGLIALMAQGLGEPTGFLNPLIYQSSVSTACFNDITQGNNDAAGTGGQFIAGPDWDACTGLGSPRGCSLMSALAASVSKSK